MNIYGAFRRWVHYFRANNRHGTHSPFVYRFVEQVLNGGPFSQELTISGNWKPSKAEIDFLQRIISVYQLPATIYPISEHPDNIARAYFFLPGAEFRIPNEEDVILVPGIFDSPESYTFWKELIKTPGVPLSIETSVMGLLFFRKEFLVKQHFRLKRG